MPLSDEFAQVYSLADSIRIWMVRSPRRVSVNLIYLANLLPCTGTLVSFSDSRSLFSLRKDIDSLLNSEHLNAFLHSPPSLSPRCVVVNI